MSLILRYEINNLYRFIGILPAPHVPYTPRPLVEKKINSISLLL
jgi:hypothetical protein